jgi:hypothetical protein
MGMDIYVWREAVLGSKQNDDGNRETLIRKTDMYRGGGWAIGALLQDTFDLDNCKQETIDLNRAYEGLKEGAKIFDRNDEDAKLEDYQKSLEVLLAVLMEGREYNSNPDNVYAEYYWELWW